MTKKDMLKGNFRLTKNGDIEYYIGWCVLEHQDIEDLKYLLAEKELKQLEEK